MMVVEYTRSLLGYSDANSTEFDTATTHPVIDLMPEQLQVKEMGGTMRLGVYKCQLVPDTLAAKAYWKSEIEERHRHRYEFNNAYRAVLEEVGLIASGLSPDGLLVEISEAENHPFMLGTQFHPEFLSRPERPHPLFRDFLGATLETIRKGDQRPLPLVRR